MIRPRARALAAALLFLSPAPFAANAAHQEVPIGDEYPDLRLPTVDGSRTVRLSAHRGQRLLLIEFASW